MSDTHLYRPTDEFRGHLESEIRRRYRANAREHPRAEPPRTTRFARIAAIVVASAAIGASAGFASAQIAQTSVRDSLLANARAEAMLAKTRFDIAQAEVNEASKKVQSGAGDQQELNSANADFRDMQARYYAAALNAEEISTSGRAPRDDLGAPVVGNKDYVKLRIQLEAVAVQARLNLAEAAQADAERRYRVGATDEGVLLAARLKVLHEQGYLAVIAEKLKARDEFLAKGTDPAELLRRIEATQVKADAAYSQAELTNAKARLALVEKMHGAGTASEVDLLRAQLAVKELEVEVQRLAARLRADKR
jgi:hypothetical protein